jgi:hypothetical protein
MTSKDFVPVREFRRYIPPAERAARLKRPGEDWRSLNDLTGLEPGEFVVEQLVVDEHGTRRVGWGKL